MPDDDIPDESIWGHPKRLEEWFEAVKQRRSHPGMEPITDDESGDMMRNELVPDDLRKSA